jgi:hypothetical protein
MDASASTAASISTGASASTASTRIRFYESVFAGSYGHDLIKVKYMYIGSYRSRNQAELEVHKYYYFYSFLSLFNSRILYIIVR